MTGEPAGTALVLVAHGTASPQGRQVVHDLVDAVRAARPELAVADAYVDVQEPKVADVVARLAPEYDEVVAVPLLFCGGYHVRVDVAKAVAPHDNARSTGALGPSRLIADLLAQRLREAGASPGDAIVMSAAGSSRVEATADARAQARLLADVWGTSVDVAFGSAATPSVPDAVSANRDHPRARVAVAALLLGEGHFHDQLTRSGADIVTAPLGACPQIVEQILTRFDEE
ncbi:sirohydrochlorin chelatase [Dermacoccus nishinomiyaensis]|uniref:sirohydrochlorin chelatase n=1 Tax=Dermacoccus nishinomiyaensis TaxID=1274 RepID=UPI001EF6E9BD|nr:CbiX/SirB N-terminal domain-containing protein [Dermacoccus nishinomiyaensis]MCG7428545.1 sirohydrochlorin chelatase [Dermacoccus nishinomiyaensis]